MNLKILKDSHPTTKNRKKYLENNCSEFLKNKESRLLIKKMGKWNEDVLTVKIKLQKNVLNIVQEKSKHGTSSSIIGFGFTGDWGVKGYVSTKYLTEKLGKLFSEENLEIAKMLCFEAINLGILSQNTKSKNMKCAIEFAKHHKSLIKKIAKEHPEYFIDGSILKTIAKIVSLDKKLVDSLIGEELTQNPNFDGNGFDNYKDSSYWNQYAKEGMDELLHLRVKDADMKGVKLMVPDYVYNDNNDSSTRLAEELVKNLETTNKIIIALNLYAKHWVGIMVEKINDKIKLSYMDSECNDIPDSLKSNMILKLKTSCHNQEIVFSKINVEMQKSNNCGPETIENLIFAFTGDRIPQEDVIHKHSELLENMLLGSVPDNSAQDTTY